MNSRIKAWIPRRVLQAYWKLRYPDYPRHFKAWVNSLWQYLSGPAPYQDFPGGYDQYWRIRGDAKKIRRRWEIAATIIEPGSSLLEVGCGSDEFLSYLKSRKADVAIRAIDTSELAAERTRTRGFSASCIDLTKQPLAADFDYITCFEVLEHVQDAEILFGELIRHVRKKLVVSMPNIGCLRCRARLALFGRFPPSVVIFHMKEHIRFWTIRDFKEWVRMLGGEVVALHGQYGSTYLPWKRWPGLFAWGLVYVIEPRRKEERHPHPPEAQKNDRIHEVAS